MAKATVFLVIFVELLSRLYCFAHAGTVAEGSILKTSHWIGTKQVTASNPSLFPNCRSQVLSLLALSFCLFVLFFSCWCLGITHFMLLDYLLSCCSFCLVVVVLLLLFVFVFVVVVVAFLCVLMVHSLDCLRENSPACFENGYTFLYGYC